MIKGYNIICFGSADWDNPFKTNQHNIMKRLSSYNRILFIESLGLRRPVFQKKDVKRIVKRLFKSISGIRKQKGNLYVYSPLVIPFHKFILVRKFNNLFLKITLYFILKKYKFTDNLVWTYIPNVIDFLGVLDSRLLIYHCVDELSANPLIPDEIRQIEKKLLIRADAVFVTSKNLFNRKHKYNQNTYYFPNVTDFKHFNSAYRKKISIPKELNDLKKPIVGFIGAVSDYKLDFELLKFISKELPDISVVIIGPLGEGEKSVDMNKILSAANLYYLGPKPYEILPKYLSSFDVCLLPNKINEYTINMFPMKFFDYLAAGKPIVSTNLPSLREFKEYFYLSSTREEFIRNIKTALKENDSNRVKKRIKLASQYNWENRIEEVSEIIKNIQNV